jgi:hypothetical protein
MKSRTVTEAGGGVSLTYDMPPFTMSSSTPDMPTRLFPRGQMKIVCDIRIASKMDDMEFNRVRVGRPALNVAR